MCTLRGRDESGCSRCPESPGGKNNVRPSPECGPVDAKKVPYWAVSAIYWTATREVRVTRQVTSDEWQVIGCHVFKIRAARLSKRTCKQ